MICFHQKFIVTVVLLCAALVSAPAQTQTPQNVNQLIGKAVEALENGKLNDTKIILQRVFRMTPNNAAAHSLAGIIAERENDLKTAEKHFALAARLQPKSPETRNNYGAILLRLNRRAEAAREFAASLAVNPNQPSALVNLAQIRFAANDFEAARALFEKAKFLQPDAEIARALLIISLRTKNAERAKSDFADYFSLAKDAAKQAARIELGLLLLENELFAEAVRELEAALALDASNIAARVHLSRAYLRQKNIRAAGRLLETAVASGADDARIYAALAEIYQAGGFMENAIPAMRRAIEKEPNNEFWRAQYGMLLIDSRAPAAAVVRLAEAVKEFPNSARLWLALGIAEQIDGKITHAQRSFEKSLQLEPKSVPALAYLATSLIEQAQYAEAVKLYERALAVEEKNAVLHYLLADTLLKIAGSDAKLIEKHLVRAVELDQKLSSAHLALGKLYARAENWQKAADEFQQAVSFAPELAEAYYQLGRALARLKRADESRVALDRFKRLNDTQTAKKETDRQELVRRLANVRF
jgi:Tfp pilus assembly protein PilF